MSTLGARAGVLPGLRVVRRAQDRVPAVCRHLRGGDRIVRVGRDGHEGIHERTARASGGAISAACCVLRPPWLSAVAFVAAAATLVWSFPAETRERGGRRPATRPRRSPPARRRCSPAPAAGARALHGRAAARAGDGGQRGRRRGAREVQRLQCPPCGQTFAEYKPVLAKYAKEYPGKVKFITKDYPARSRVQPPRAERQPHGVVRGGGGGAAGAREGQGRGDGGLAVRQPADADSRPGEEGRAHASAA